ncbi:MAG: SDR family oxidoreductase [Myxococcota bacterium]|jgi:citronellol/citronellal dehydrogenase|nr:SDR family oxidoreductase [Myxococcota bacterium]
MRLKDRVVFITGASRGIGKVCALTYAKEGAHVALASKTMDPHPKLPGTILETAQEIEALGRKALPIQLDVRDAEACEQAIDKTLDAFGQIDIMVHNAGALWWAEVKDTPVRKYDLIMNINVRAGFILSHKVLPHMLERNYGHILMMSPPVDTSVMRNHGAYGVSKFGMSMIAQAIAEECEDTGVTAHSLWPATAVETAATINFGLGNAAMWRTPEILADASLELLAQNPATSKGQAWIDEDVLKNAGLEDFTRYRCDPEHEPPHLSIKDIPPVSAPPKN